MTAPRKEHIDQILELMAAALPADARIDAPDYSSATDLWSARGQVPGQRDRVIEISDEVIKNLDTDWALLIEQLRLQAMREFRHPTGVVIRVRLGRGPEDRGGFYSRPDTLDLRPRQHPGPT